MVKLQAAKCPSCGADIQVNEKLENTICQYCGSTVLVEDAIEKYKIEISGNVKVEGIKGRNDKIEQAKKHHKYDELEKAKNLIKEIVKDDEFDTEAYCELLRIDIDMLNNQLEFDKSRGPEVQWQKYLVLKEAFDTYDRINKIDENKIAQKELKDYLDDIEDYQAYQKELDEDEKRFAKVYAKHRELAEKARKINDETQQQLLSAFNEVFGTKMSTYGTLVTDYIFRKDGTLVEPNRTTYYEPSTITTSSDEMEERIKLYLSKAEEIVNKRAKKSIFMSRFSFAGSLIAGLISGAFAAVLGGYTISLFINGHIFGAILMIIFVDSWLFLYPAMFSLGCFYNAFATLKHKKTVKETLKNDNKE